jgi:hypothetical protein
MQAYIGGVTRHVVYTASGSQLTRSLDGGAAAVLQKDMTSSSVFTYTDSVTNVQLIGMSLSVHPINRPNTTLVLSSEARLRNRGTA